MSSGVGIDRVSVGGCVIAIKPVRKTDTQGPVANTWTDISDLAFTYAATNASNSIRIQGVINVGFNHTTNSTYVRFLRDGVLVGAGPVAGSRERATGYGYGSVSTMMVGIPIDFTEPAGSIASSIWKAQFMSYNAAGAAYINRPHTDTDATSNARVISSLTLTEFVPS